MVITRGGVDTNPARNRKALPQTKLLSHRKCRSKTKNNPRHFRIVPSKSGRQTNRERHRSTTIDAFTRAFQLMRGDNRNAGTNASSEKARRDYQDRILRRLSSPRRRHPTLADHDFNRKTSATLFGPSPHSKSPMTSITIVDPGAARLKRRVNAGNIGDDNAIDNSELATRLRTFRQFFDPLNYDGENDYQPQPDLDNFHEARTTFQPHYEVPVNTGALDEEYDEDDPRAYIRPPWRFPEVDDGYKKHELERKSTYEPYFNPRTDSEIQARKKYDRQRRARRTAHQRRELRKVDRNAARRRSEGAQREAQDLAARGYDSNWHIPIVQFTSIRTDYLRAQTSREQAASYGVTHLDQVKAALKDETSGNTIFKHLHNGILVDVPTLIEWHWALSPNPSAYLGGAFKDYFGYDYNNTFTYTCHDYAAWKRDEFDTKRRWGVDLNKIGNGKRKTYKDRKHENKARRESLARRGEFNHDLEPGSDESSTTEEDKDMVAARKEAEDIAAARSWLRGRGVPTPYMGNVAAALNIGSSPMSPTSTRAPRE